MTNIQENPYIGLRPYTFEDKNKFFGRDQEKQILFDKILANKLTLLFAASGVGKSSLLRAGIIPELMNNNYDVVYFFEWADQPEISLKQAIVKALKDQQRINDDYQVNLELPLAKFIKIHQLLCEERLIIILDQFEEFFNYARLKEDFKPFIESLSDAIQAHDTTTIFVLSMREDFAMELNAFKSYVSGIFDNFYRLEKLTKQAAQQAILKPLEQVGFKFEENLLENILEDLSRREQIDRYGLEQALQMKDAPLFVEPPHLQIVCSQLWELELELNQPDQTIHFKIYEKHGKAQGFLKNHFISKISQLSKGEQILASAAFDFLVNKHGTKMAYPLNELAKLLRKDEKPLAQTLNKLEQARILRKTERYSYHQTQPVIWFELYHDVFAKSAYEWNEEFRIVRRFIKITKITTIAMILGIGIDIGVNWYFQHLRVNLKTNRVEIYQGYLNSFDVFKQQHFLTETNFKLDEFEADKRFGKQAINRELTMLVDLVGKLPVEQRIKAFLEMGEFELALSLAQPFLEKENSSSNKIVQYLVQTRSLKGLNLLQYISVSPTLKKTISNIAAYFPTGSNIVTLLKTFLKDNDANVRSSAVNALGQLQVKEVIPQLIDLLKDNDVNVRSNVVKALGKLQVKEAASLLIDLLKDNDINVCSSAINTLVKLQIKEAIPHLIDLLKDNNPKIRSRAIDALGELQAKEVIPQLIDLFKDNDSDVRFNVVKALGILRAKEVIPQLIELLEDNDITVRSSTIDALGELQAKEAIPQLIDLLKDNDIQLRPITVKALGKLQAKEAINQLIELLEDNNIRVRSRTIDALGELQAKEVIPQLIDLLKYNSPRVRFSAINALVKLQAKEAIPQLIDLLKDNDANVRSSAINSLAKLQIKIPVEQFIDLLKDNDANVRSSAINASAKLQIKIPVDQLINLLKDIKKNTFDESSRKINVLSQLSLEQLLDVSENQLFTDYLPKNNNLMAHSNEITELVKLQAKEVIPSLLKLSINYDIKLREQIIIILSNLKVKQVIPAILDNYHEIKNSIINSPEDKNSSLNILQNITNKLGIKHFGFIQQSEFEKITPNSNISLDFSCLKELILNKETTNKTKIDALWKIGTLQTQEATQLIIEQFDEFGVFTIQALGNIPQKKRKDPKEKNEQNKQEEIALSFLRKQLDRLEKDKQELHQLREKDNLNEIEQQRFQTLQEQSYLETEVAHSIAKLNSNEGIKLLKHPFAEVRSGALIGISHYININTFKELLKTFQETTTPLYRFTLYKAIDSSLLTFESTATQEDLNQLVDLKEKLQETTNQHKAIKDRLEWTINEINYRLKNPPNEFEETPFETSEENE
jgi:HEAT repeat protein